MRSSLLALLIVIMGTPVYAESERPNIVLVMTDDQGYGDFGVHGNPIVKTPNLDRFAKEGIQFRNFYVSPVCAPTRSSLMTGRYNYRTGVVDTYLGRAMMHVDERTLAEMLSQVGYRTGIFGKWHLGDNYPMRAQDQGFQEVLVHNGGGIGQPADPPGNLYTNPTLQHNGKSTKYNGYCSDIFTTGAIDFIGKGDGKPFFAYIAFNCPHGPYQIADDKVKPYRGIDLSPAAFPKIGQPMRPSNPEEVARVYGMVENIDQNFGRLLAHLREQKLADNTLVIFLTDNGPGGIRFNGGLRMAKGTVYEGGIRVPCFVQYPAKFRQPRLIDEISAHIDWVPTICDLCGIEKPGNLHWDGVSRLPLLRGDAVPASERSLFFQWHRGDEPELYRAFAVRTPTFKLVQANGAGEAKNFKRNYELFDIANDPYEMKDLATEQPETVKKLLASYQAWFKDVSSTRGYAPPVIVLGHEKDNPSTLTRQDWRGPQAGWTPKSIGHWEVNFDRPGNYAITVNFSPSQQAEELFLDVSDTKLSKPVLQNTDKIRLVLEKLPRGNTRFSPRLKSESGERGVDYVEVEWLSD